MRLRKGKDKCVSSLVPGWDQKKHISWRSSHFSAVSFAKWGGERNSSGNNSANSEGECVSEPWLGLSCFSHECRTASVDHPHPRLWLCVCGHPWQVQTVWALGRPQWDPALSFHKSNCLKHRQQTEIDFFSPSCFIPGMIKYLLITYFPMSNSLLPRLKCHWGRWGKRSLFT